MTEEAHDLCEKCLTLSYREGIRAYHNLVRYCLEKVDNILIESKVCFVLKGDVGRAKDVLIHLNETTPINKKVSLLIW